MNALLTIKTDSETKAQLRDFAAELGVSSTAVVNMLVKQALRDRRIILNTNLKPTSYLEKIMREAEEDYKTNRNVSGPFKTAEAMIADLEK